MRRTCEELVKHKMDPSKVTLSFVAKVVKPLLVKSFAEACAKIPKEKVLRAWEKTKLHTCWNQVQTKNNPPIYKCIKSILTYIVFTMGYSVNVRRYVHEAVYCNM